MKPGYKKTEVGVIPEDWEVSKVGDVCGCIVPGRNKPKFFDGDIPWITTPDLENGKPVTTSKLGLRISRAEAKVVGSKVVPPRSVLMSCAGELGITALTQNELVVNQQLHVFIPTARIDGTFVCYYINTRTNNLREVVATGNGQPNLNTGLIEEIQIPFPSPTEQRAIATALSDVDALLDGLDRLIAKKRDLKQAAMQKLLTGQTRLPGFQGEWEVTLLGDHVTFLRNGVHSRAELSVEDSVKYLHYGDIHTSTQLRLDPVETQMPSLPADRAQTLDRLRDGDLVFVDASEDLDGVGKSVEISGVADAEIVAGLHTIAARFDKSVLADGFKAYLRFFPEFREQLRRLAAGTKVHATNRAHIASAELRLPNTAEQTAIAAVLSDMDAELAAQEQRRDKTRALKQAMMQELLTGRTRLV